MTQRFPDGMSVRTKALAVRMYGVASEHEWNLTLPELAEMLGEDCHRVRRVSQLHKWTRRFRSCTADTYAATGAVILMADAALDEMGMR